MLSREYETIYIMRPDLGEDEEAAVSQRVSAALEKTQARVLKLATWGKRKLAYEIANYSKGVYVSAKYLSGPEAVMELERNLKIMDNVIRFQTFKIAERVDVEKRLAEQAADDAREAAEQAERERQRAERERLAAEEAARQAAQAESAAGEPPADQPAPAETEQPSAAAPQDDESPDQEQ